jgi:signal transduction histidine kinase/DNA-binding response OmpR family regulator
MRFCIYTALTFIVIVLLGALHGCEQSPPPKKYRIGFSQCCNDPWRDVMKAEMLRELAFYPELDFDMRVSENNSEKQVEQIRELVAAGIDILLVSPNESRPLTPVIEEVYKAGIPVVLIDRKTESPLYTAYIGANNYEIGRTAATYVANRLQGPGQVIEILLPLTISPGSERNRGFRDGIAKIPAIRVVAALETKRGLEDIHTMLPDLLRRHPDANVIFGHTDLLAETAHQIVQEQGRAGQMIFVGIDGIPGTGRGIQAVEDGVLDASMLYPTGGGEAIRLALSMLNKLPFEKENDLETIVIDSNNARILHNQMKKVNSLQKSIDEQVKGLEALQTIYRSQRVYIAVLLSSLLLALVLGMFLWQSLRIQQAARRSLEAKNREILEHERQIVEMSDEVRRATQAKVDFFTNISHEFRTPLTLILAFAEDLLPSQKLSRDEQQSIGHIRQNAFRLLGLVNQLMDFQKTESGRMQLRASENDLIGFVRHIVESYAKTARKRGIDFQLLTRHERLPVWFDAGMMDKVLFNLLSNAFKFTPDGGKIHLSIAVDKQENRVKLSVEDSGQGMSAEEIGHVFEPFYQAQSPSQPPPGGKETRWGGGRELASGTGLGLSLTKSLVELHGGEISAKSTQGKGSRFTVALPLGKEHLPDDQTGSGQPSEVQGYGEQFLLNTQMEPAAVDAIGANTASDLQILVIEDNEELQFFLRKKLGGTYQVEPATTGLEGLQKAYDLTPDLIVCDIMLPGLDGLAITRTLKSDLRTSHIPIVLLSARGTVEQQIEGAETGADAYVTKPFNVQFLLATIRSLLFNRQVLKESYGKGLIAHSFETPTVELPATTTALDRDFIRKFLVYIHQHYTRQDFQVTDLCQELGLSRSQLYRKVTALLGESIGDHIENLRIKKAEELLLEGKISITEIAYQVGYSSPDYFSTVFKSKYNVTPSQFRKSTLERSNEEL